MMTRARLILAGIVIVAITSGWLYVRHLNDQLRQARTDNAIQAERLSGLYVELEQAGARHALELAQRDKALAAHRVATQAAAAANADLQAAITRERETSADVDACMRMQLPDGIAERLRQ